MKLNQCINVKAQFHRSIQIERDRVLDDYILTRIGIKIIQRVQESFSVGHRSRAWSITGPYGSGKSAFIVFLKNVFGASHDRDTHVARKKLRSKAPELFNKLFSRNALLSKKPKGFCHAFVSAGREQIEHAVLRGLSLGLRDFFRSSKNIPRLIEEIEKAIHKSQSRHLSEDIVVGYCEKAARLVCNSNGAGILLVIDELGKCLEAAALQPKRDIFVLQKMAEAAARSQAAPILFFTVLHQSFERYVAKLDIETRNEWAKIQGRFDDIAFVDTNEQVYQLIASAFEKRGAESWLSDAKINASFSALQSFLKDDPRATKDFFSNLKDCLPLHPLTTMALVPMFRSRFAQNERSLFAFLTSVEPNGFSDFLFRTENTRDENILYKPHHFYDYLTSSLGVNLFTQHYGKKWVEMDQALSRTNDPLEQKVIKTIGIMNLLSENLGLPVSAEVVSCALSSIGETAKRGVADALERLCRKSVVVYRRHSHSYMLWGGSDIDIEAKIRDVKANKIPIENIAAQLNQYFPLRAKVAKRHLYETGTLRYFNMRYVDYRNLEQELKMVHQTADGEILLVLDQEASQKKAEQIPAFFSENSEFKNVSSRILIGYALEPERTVDLFRELLALEWIKKNTPELQGDLVAMREVEARLLQLEELVLAATDELFFESDATSYWFDSKTKIPCGNISKRKLSSWVSDICDRVYDKAPIIKNELINRDRISSTIALARRTLMQAIFKDSAKERLGFVGYPPELSIYESVFKASGLHKKTKDGWRFAASCAGLEKSWVPLWGAIDKFLIEHENQKVQITKLYELMQGSPYGVREALHPLLIAVLIKAYDKEIAVFEQGTFKPVMYPSDFDVIAKVPHKFSLQLCKIKGVKAQVFEKIVDALVTKNEGAATSVSLLSIVKMLCFFAASLPDFVKTTQSIGKRTKQVRKCLLEALEPASLLYRDLPIACGFNPITSHSKGKEVLANEFVSRLKQAIIELQRAEKLLYGQILHTLLRTFDVQDDEDNFREILAKKAECLSGVTMDAELTAFLTRVSENHDQKTWLDSMATLVVKRPPSAWTDDDLIRYEHDMLLKRAQLAKYQRIVLAKRESSSNGDDEMIQISVTSTRRPERYVIVQASRDVAASDVVLDQLKKSLSPHIQAGGHDLVLRALTEYTSLVIDGKKEADIQKEQFRK